MKHCLALALSYGAFAACSVPPGAVPAAVRTDASGRSVGRGIISVSETAPVGAKSWPRPQWHEGDQFTLVRGERLTATFTVRSIDDGNYIIDMGNGSVLRRDQDLGNLGHWLDATGEAQRELLPADARYHWPLWVGKRWSCEFVDRTRTGESMVMVASYEVEDMDRIEVPAGSYDALRIRRTLRLAEGGERVLTRAELNWYAPEPGLEVRQLIGDTMVELVGYTGSPATVAQQLLVGARPACAIAQQAVDPAISPLDF